MLSNLPPLTTGPDEFPFSYRGNSAEWRPFSLPTAIRFDISPKADHRTRLRSRNELLRTMGSIRCGREYAGGTDEARGTDAVTFSWEHAAARGHCPQLPRCLGSRLPVATLQ